MGVYASTTKERGITMPKKIVLEFPVDLPEESLQNKEAIRKGKETIVLELFRKRKISSGYAADLLGLCLVDFMDLLKRENEPFSHYTKKEFKKDLEAKALIHPVKAKSFLKHVGLSSVGGEAVKESENLK